jgi:rod shape-determining protein MreB
VWADPGSIVAIKPMKDGVIADFKVTKEDAELFHSEGAQPQDAGIRGVVACPRRSRRWKSAVMDSAYRANQRSVSRGTGDGGGDRTGLPIADQWQHGGDIGGGTADIEVISLSGIVYSRSVRMAGNQMDEAIMNYLKRKYNLLVGERTARQIKMEIGSAYPLDKPLTMEIKGRTIEGVPKTITVDDSEIRGAQRVYMAIMNAVASLERTPPGFGGISDQGHRTDGRRALIKNLDKRSAKKRDFQM